MALVALVILLSYVPSSANAEDVIFIVPGASDPSSTIRFDPELQIIQKGQSIVFVNADGIDHQLLVSSSDGQLEFDTGVLTQNKFVSHTFTEDGQYSIQDKDYSHMRGKILVTDDIATFSRTMDDLNLEVQLARTPAYPQTHQEVYYKITFIDKETGRNRSHIDFTLTFNNSSGGYYDGVGGHTVDGQEFARFTFGEDTFTQTVTVSGIDFVPISPERAEFDTVVTPEFMPAVLAIIVMVAISMTIILSKRISRIEG